MDEKRVAIVLDTVLRNGDLAKITKAELVAVIKSMAQPKLPVREVVVDDRMIKVFCRKQSCHKAATMPRSKAVNWACSTEHAK